MGGACYNRVYRGYSDNTIINLAMYTSSNSLLPPECTRDALRWSENPKISGKRASSSTRTKCVHKCKCHTHMGYGLFAVSLTTRNFMATALSNFISSLKQIEAYTTANSTYKAVDFHSSSTSVDVDTSSIYPLMTYIHNHNHHY